MDLSYIILGERFVLLERLMEARCENGGANPSQLYRHEYVQ